MSSECKIHLLDGGLGTTLGDSHQVQFTEKEPLWSSQLLIPTHPHGPNTLLATQKSFVDAGADILLTATYQASYEGFGRSGYAVHSHSSSGFEKEDGDKEEVNEIMRSAVDIASNAFSVKKDSNGKIALSLGAYGAIMTPGQEYTGKYDDQHKSSEHLSSWHHERISVFSRDPKSWDRVDYVAFETIPLLEEIEGVRKSMGEIERSNGGKTGSKPFWVTCVFPGEGNGLPDGSSVQQIVQAMLSKKEGSPVPFGVGLNCTKVGKVEALILDFEREVRSLIEKGDVSEWPSLVVYPDGTIKGEVYNTSTKVWEIREPPGKEDLQWDEAVLEIVRRTRDRGGYSNHNYPVSFPVRDTLASNVQPYLPTIPERRRELGPIDILNTCGLTKDSWYYFSLEQPLGAVIGDDGTESQQEVKEFRLPLGFDHIRIVIGRIIEARKD